MAPIGGDGVDRTPDDAAAVRAAERRLDADLERMARESERVKRRVERTREDWEATRDPELPGAGSPDDAPAARDERADDDAG